MQLVTIKFPQPPFYGTVADQRHLKGERRKSIYKKENRIVRIWTRLIDKGGTKKV